MLLRPETCPICQHQVDPHNVQCPTCGCVVQFSPEPPVFSRGEVIEALVQPTIQLTKERLARNPNQSLAHYLLGLCFLNLSFIDRGAVEYQEALAIDPANDLIRFELAMVRLSQGKHASALEQIKLALQQDPTVPAYKYMEQYLAGRAAQARGRVEDAVRHWIAAYEISPAWTLATGELRDFVGSYEAALTRPGVTELPGLSEHEIAYLRILNDDPRARDMKLPAEPHMPLEPDRVSLGVLRRVAPVLAVRIEGQYQQRMADYYVAAEEREEERQAAVQKLKNDLAAWRAKVHQLSADLGLMAGLCLAVLIAAEQSPQADGVDGNQDGSR